MNDTDRYYKIKDGLSADGLIIRARPRGTNDDLKGWVIKRGFSSYDIGHYTDGWNRQVFELIPRQQVDIKWSEILPETCKRCITKSCNGCEEI